MLLGQLLGHGRQRNDVTVLSSSLQAAMGKNGREVARGVLFIRVGFLACATRSPLQFYLHFEACLFFSWDLRKISRVGDKLIALVRTMYEFGDRALRGSCKMKYEAVKGCGAGGVRHGTRTESSAIEGDWRRVASSGRGVRLATLIQRGAGSGGLCRGNGEGKRWAGCRRIGPTGRVFKIAFPIFKQIFYFPNYFDFKPCLNFDRF
jgi:hypothetical protein